MKSTLYIQTKGEEKLNRSTTRKLQLYDQCKKNKNMLEAVRKQEHWSTPNILVMAPKLIHNPQWCNDPLLLYFKWECCDEKSVFCLKYCWVLSKKLEQSVGVKLQSPQTFIHVWTKWRQCVEWKKITPHFLSDLKEEPFPGGGRRGMHLLQQWRTLLIIDWRPQTFNIVASLKEPYVLFCLFVLCGCFYPDTLSSACLRVKWKY